MFLGSVVLVCGGVLVVMGLFYCFNDCKIYLDMDFFCIMQIKMGVGGDFVYVYVVVYEVGYYVQNVLGIFGQLMKVCQ